MDDLHGPGLGESQRTLLELIKRAGEVTLAGLEHDIGVARETVRSHLAALVGARLVERSGVRRSGPGRPQIVYRLTAEGDALFPRREGELLADLARFLLANGQGGLLEGFFVERTERRRERLMKRVEGLDGGERLQEVARVLSEEGFLAELRTESESESEFESESKSDTATAPAATLRLCHCPLRDLVAVTQLPCRFEQILLESLLGRSLERTGYRPDGDACCSYLVTAVPAAAGRVV
ncbi:MAG: hypothetical protein ABI609_16045 [Acidobacteriota bacterium]